MTFRSDIQNRINNLNTQVNSSDKNYKIYTAVYSGVEVLSFAIDASGNIIIMSDMINIPNALTKEMLLKNKALISYNNELLTGHNKITIKLDDAGIPIPDVGSPRTCEWISKTSFDDGNSCIRIDNDGRVISRAGVDTRHIKTQFQFSGQEIQALQSETSSIENLINSLDNINSSYLQYERVMQESTNAYNAMKAEEAQVKSWSDSFAQKTAQKDGFQEQSDTLTQQLTNVIQEKGRLQSEVGVLDAQLTTLKNATSPLVALNDAQKSHLLEKVWNEIDQDLITIKTELMNSANIDPHYSSKSGSLLQIAINTKNGDLLQKLIDNGLDLSVNSVIKLLLDSTNKMFIQKALNGEIPGLDKALYKLIKAGDDKYVAKIVEQAPEEQALAKFAGYSLFQYALHFGNLNMAEYLLRANEKVLSEESDSGNSPLKIMILRKNLAAIEFLKEHGADFTSEITKIVKGGNLTASSMNFIIKLLEYAPEEVSQKIADIRDDMGDNILHQAIVAKISSDKLEKLVQAAPDLCTVKNNQDQTPFAKAMANNVNDLGILDSVKPHSIADDIIAEVNQDNNLGLMGSNEAELTDTLI